MSIETNKTIQQGSSLNMVGLEAMKIWVYEHPTTVKIVKVAGLVLGIGLIASLPFSAPLLAAGIVASLAVTGALLTLSFSVALLAFDIFFSPHHEMRDHVYKPGECEGGKLYYEGDVPILSLEADDPFKAGRAHGYLCGEAINRLSKCFGMVLHTIAKELRADQLPHLLAHMRYTIPHEYLKEMEGIVEGYNLWAKEQAWWQFPKKLTVDDLLLFHLIPDSMHFDAAQLEDRLVLQEYEVMYKTNPKQLEGIAQAQLEMVKARLGMELEMAKAGLRMACSAIVDRHLQHGFTLARNMDWPSLGLAGAYSLVINRKHTNGLRSTVEVCVPSFVGTLTGMNDQGLCLAMNVCEGKTQEFRGLPATLYNRACLEKCRNAQEVEDFTRKQSPLGPYHMTVVDKESAQSIHFYQAADETHLSRRWEENKPLSTLNCRYSPEPNTHFHYSVQRQKLIDQFFKDRGTKSLEEVLSLPFVNNSETTHRILMQPNTGEFKVAFDDAFAGKIPLQVVPAGKLLGNV